MPSAKKSSDKTKRSRAKAPSRPATRSTVRRIKAAKSSRSIGLTRESRPFFSVQLTKDTLYWFILSVLVLALGVWVIIINDRVQRIYDAIDRTTAAEDSITLPVAKK